MKIVSFSRALPFEGIPHAGGEYVLRHIEALIESGHEVCLIVPADERNLQAFSRFDLGARVLFIPLSGSPFARARRWMTTRARPALPSPELPANLLRETDIVEALQAADLVEYHWTETSYLHRAVARVLPSSVPVICVAQDVLTQKFQRAVQGPGGGVRRVLRHIRSWFVTADEVRMLKAMNRIVTFSEKDQQLLQHLRTGVPVGVINPPLEPSDERWTLPRTPDELDVLFVGAFSRPENATAAVWLMSDVWPRVLERLPRATLQVVGSNPSAEMVANAESRPSVHIVGYVDDLVPYYQSAAVVVVPLLSGAGVKFKTITAMLWGVPLVSTPVGIEGIAEPGSDLFVGVTEDPAEFAAAIVAALNDKAWAEGTAQRAREFSTQAFGRSTFSRHLNSIYLDMRGKVAGESTTSAV